MPRDVSPSQLGHRRQVPLQDITLGDQPLRRFHHANRSTHVKDTHSRHGGSTVAGLTTDGPKVVRVGYPPGEHARVTAPRHTLPTIVAAQFAGTSLWFVGNAALGGFADQWQGVEGAVGWLTSAVQLGFIAGTFLFAVLGLADRIPSHRLFFGCSIFGAAFNAAGLIAPHSFSAFVATRMLTGIAAQGGGSES